MVTYHEDEQNKIIADLKSQQEESYVKKTASDIGVAYIDLTGITINTDALRLLEESVARQAEMAVYAMIGKKIDIAVKSITNSNTLEHINKLESQGFETTIHLASLHSLQKAWGRYGDISQSESARGGLLDITDEALQEIVATVKTNEDVAARLQHIYEQRDSHQISKIMETVFGSAIGLKSSDVHFEPEETFTRLRFREDGLLQEISRLDPATYQRLVNRVKFLSGMKLTNTSIAQDGRFTIVYKGMDVEVRVAVAPGAYNESIVMRILNPEGLAVDFEKLGIEPRLFKILQQEIAKPNGMMLTTGPTGSGKTTTLYSFLKKIYSPDIKIITIEDPIEYHLPGITQEQVNHEKGFDFLAGLRAALRQDPDVIMVGEIRDKETATIAVNASLTGHMVFSTLHTNSAAGTIPRLLDLGIQPGILSAALTVSIAQRLVRRLCPDCKKQVTLSGDQETLVRAIIKNGERIGKDFAAYNISSSMPLTAYEPVGCEICHGSGFKERVGLYEAILTDDVIAKVMAQEPTPTEREIKKAAEHQKIFTMIEDGVIKILTGATSMAEIQGVIDLSEDVGSPGSENNLNDPKASELPPLEHTLQEAHEVIHSVSGLTNPPAEELHVLIDYLKILERDLVLHQTRNPNIDVNSYLIDIRNNIEMMLREVVK